jgi:hypothetical protein
MKASVKQAGAGANKEDLKGINAILRYMKGRIKLYLFGKCYRIILYILIKISIT